MLLAATSCISQQKIGKDKITQQYPELYNAIYSRGAGQILPFTQNSDSQIRSQAWRGIAQTPIDSLSSLIEKVKQDGSRAAWFALSKHNLSAVQLRNVEQHWLDYPNLRAGVSVVLGQQGDEETLSFIQSYWSKIVRTDFEQEIALAVSRLITRYTPDSDLQQKIIDAAFATDDPAVIRAWLYGFYRGDGSITPPQKDSLYAAWQSYGMGKHAVVDQYIAKIMGAPVFSEIVNHYASSGAFDEQVQLGIELANLVGDVTFNEVNTSSIKILLNHSNPHVVQQALANLSGRLVSGNSVFSFIKLALIGSDQTSPFVWLQALNTAATVDSAVVLNHAEGLQKISESHPYLYPQVLQARMKAEHNDAFLNHIETTIGKGSPLKSMYAVNALNEFWSALHQNKAIKMRVRSMIFNALALGDRGVTFSSQPLLQDSLLFTKDDFPRINRSLANFSLPGDIEVYQTFGALYKQRFETQARPVIDSLAALNYVPLNRSLQQAGWNVEVPRNTSPKFKIPDWERLRALGDHPVWVLETEKGIIKVKMNVLSAPATISAIDSLTQAGAYNGVPFHRMVPNFVIQGGDIERDDGFGGPDFTIPTEASEQGFVRGAAGIASAGTDTEGSQYFFMHQWKPHLNGSYTLFGNIVEGMEVADRIIVGDMVERTYWE